MPEIISAGLLMYSLDGKEIRVFLVHPGGPYFAKKDEGYWGIPKGLPEDGESLEQTAVREFEEETGITPSNELIPIGDVVQKGGKRVFAWAFSYEGEIEIEIKCNTFSIEWPPKSGKFKSFPEVDKGIFFGIEEARKKINSAQEEFLNRLLQHLSASS